jgi:hypothetical protein
MKKDTHMSLQNDKSKPIKSFRAGKVEASIWRNEVDKDGQKSLRYSIRIQKRFRKDDGSYESTDYFFPDELPKLAALARRAFEFCVLTESSDQDNSMPV